jgi:hypothetical protein
LICIKQPSSPVSSPGVSQRKQAVVELVTAGKRGARFATNYGTFAGQNAVALTGLMRLSENMVLTGYAGYGIGNDANQFGGRAGIQVAW